MLKERIDILMVAQGHAATREQAKRMVMAGLVYHGTEALTKPGMKIAADAVLSVKGALHPFVSRGGLKLQKALNEFSLSLEGATVIDVGASTGGFTDCALQHGAALVYAVDVGYGQLAWSLRSDERVKVMERTNFRNVDVDVFDPRPTVGVMDVSFISISKLLSKLKQVLLPNAFVITLIKPQFEAGPGLVGKGGIVRDPVVHEQVILQALADATDDGFVARGLTYSPIRGGDGNIEFLLWLDVDPSAASSVSSEDAARIVRLAHAMED